jgi:hypothetical protein
MKKLLLSFIIVLSLSASEVDLKVQILSTIFDNITIKKEKIFFSDDKEVAKLLAKKYKVSKTPQKATILILKDTDEQGLLRKNQKIFVLDYNLLKKIPQSFGAFFFKKGRANIVLLAPVLHEQNIVISTKLENYVEEKIW